MLLLALSLFFTEPVPLEMPRAEAYLVRDGSALRLEDRYQALDLWTSRSVDGRWIDDEDRVFILATLDVHPPKDAGEEDLATVSRRDYVSSARAIAPDDERGLRAALAMLSPVELAEKPSKPGRPPAGYESVLYWQGTNTSAIVCTFREKKRRGKEQPWRLACWSLAEGDDFDEKAEIFDEEFLRKRDRDADEKPRRKASAKPKPPTERELLRADARHAIALYGEWHATDGDEFEVLDHLPSDRRFVASVTNEFKTMRAKYAATVPTPIDGSNVLAVARIFATREEYLDALRTDGLTNMEWSAAYWSQARRELVAYLPEKGGDELIATLRHEAFHQYLAYATSMMAVSPWFNEGYAQFFEGDGYLAADDAYWDEKKVELGENTLPVLLGMDYEAFYSGTDREREFKYKLAESVAVFIERGAQKVRFRPFEKLKADYIKALFDKKDMQLATATAFATKDNLKLFVDEWKKYMTEGRFKK